MNKTELGRKIREATDAMIERGGDPKVVYLADDLADLVEGYGVTFLVAPMDWKDKHITLELKREPSLKPGTLIIGRF
jgi:hypothetical protein